VNAPPRTTEEIILAIKAIRRGDEAEENYREIHNRYYSSIYRFFLYKGMKPEDARDLTQNTFFSVFTSIEDLRDESKFEGWLFKIALNVWHRDRERANAEKRKGKHIAIVTEGEMEESGTITGLAAQGPNPQEAALAKEKLALLHDALLELPEQCRRCTLLYVNNELKYHQIADLLGISLNTVKAHLHKAKGDLRRKLGQYFGEIDF
jgi:RNA polymerase sigma-70 factor (ECF subfamily)